MNETENRFKYLPNYLILSDKVYNLTVSNAPNSNRAFDRMLVDL